MSQIDDLDVLSDSAVIRSAEFRAAEPVPALAPLVVDAPLTASIAEREIAIGPGR